jgi:Flp pilus assembly pilin Flp
VKGRSVLTAPCCDVVHITMVLLCKEVEMKVWEIVKRFVRDEKGLETVEYAIILGIIVVATIGFIATIGGWVSNQFQDLSTEIVLH